MFGNKKRFVNPVWTTALGLALASVVCAAPTFAQSDDMRKNIEADQIQNDDWPVDPDPIRYPGASPGGLNLYHWSDYTHNKLEHGSAYEARYERMRMEREKRRASLETMAKDGVKSEENPLIDPDPIRYPGASPGGLNLYHWSDYTHSDLEHGSVYEARYEKLRNGGDKLPSDMPGFRRIYIPDEDALMVDPDPIRYPGASPGGLNLYYWSDYTHNKLEHGSVSEARYEQARERREKQRPNLEPHAMSK